jgi:hypothetical protein
VAVLSHHSRYKDFDTTWLKELTEAIPIESETERREKQSAKQVRYERVEAIPEKIHAERRRAAQSGPKDLAIGIRNQLLMLWLTVLPWRQRNLRECRVSGRRPNLFLMWQRTFMAPDIKPFTDFWIAISLQLRLLATTATGGRASPSVRRTDLETPCSHGHES